MQNIRKKKVLIILLSTFLVAMLIWSFTLSSSNKAYAAEIDYKNQAYTNIYAGFDYLDESVIYKIHCPNVREQLGVTELEIDDLVSVVSFKAAMGCQIYFVRGIPCDLEESYYDDNPTTKFQEYYDILDYDEVNENVYIKFKNVSSLPYPDDLCMWSGDNVNATQFIYISNLNAPVAEVGEEDVLLSSEVKAAHGGSGVTNFNIYSIEYKLKINQKVMHLINHIDVYLSEGSDSFNLHQSVFLPNEGVGENGYSCYTIKVLGDIGSVAKDVRITVKVDTATRVVSVSSLKTNLITLWTNLINNNFSGYDYENYMTESNKTHIRKLIESYNAGFLREIKGTQDYFVDYDASGDIKLTSLIFKVPIEKFRYAAFVWRTSYFQGYIYEVGVTIDSELKMTTTAFATPANEDGTTTVANVEYNDVVANQIYESVDYFGYDGYVYLRIKDDTPISTYFPQRAERNFNVVVWDSSFNNIPFQVNSATIIYDEYNLGLLEEIEAFQQQLIEMQLVLDASLALAESKIELINSLQSALDNIRVDYSNAQAQIEYLTEQMEVMRQEYQKKIDQLIAENKDNVNQEKPPVVEEPEPEVPTEEQDYTMEQVFGLCAGVILLMAIVTLLIPKRRR